MAYYGSNYYYGDAGQYHCTPYTNGYDIVPILDSTSYSDYEFSDSKFIEYEPTDHHGAYYTYNFSEPKFIEYNPTPSATSYFYSQTQHLVSYSTMAVDDTDFVEYDPTPYGGGYDIAQTYGKPLPPTDEICYPRGAASDANGLKVKNDAGEVLAKPPNGSKPSEGVEEEQEAYGGFGDQLNNGHDNGIGDKGQFEKLLDSNQGEEKEGYICSDNYPWSGYDYGYNKQASPAPYGYDSEAIKFCESLFGYWPCLSREDRKRYGSREIADEECKESQWNGAAADYIFGGTYSNGEWRNGRGSYGDVGYGYERHYREEPINGQVKCEESPWLQHFMIFDDCNRP